MKTKLNLILFIYFLLSIIDIASNLTIQYKQFSKPECDEDEITSLNLETIKLPKELFGSNLRLDFEDIENKTPIIFICRIKDDILQQLLDSPNDFEDVTLSCFDFSNINFNESSAIELNLINATILGGDSVDLVKEGNGENKISSQLDICHKNEANIFQTDSKIYLRQASHYEYFPQEEKVTFLLSTFVSQNLPANYTVPFVVDLAQETKIGCCISEEETKASDDNISLVNFNCQMDSYTQEDEKEEFHPLILFVNTEITYKKIDEPREVDDLITKGVMKDLSLEKMPPVFTPEKISLNDTEENVTISIKGKFNEDIEGQHDFVIEAISGQNLFCSFANVNKDIDAEIECGVEFMDNMEEIEIIGIDVFDANENGKELFLFKPIGISLLPDIVINDTDISNKTIKDISFRQVCNFETNKDLKLILFSLVVVSSETINKNETLNIYVTLIKGEELVGEEVICTSQEDVNPQDGKLLQVEFECILENIEKAEEYTGLEIIGTEGISVHQKNLKMKKYQYLMQHQLIQQIQKKQVNLL